LVASAARPVIMRRRLSFQRAPEYQPPTYPDPASWQQMYREVAEHPGNTPTVAKKSNVDQWIIELFTRGMTIDARLRPVPRSSGTRIWAR
jgi:hypothetical protein